jgi:hypothetical protein
VGHDDPSAYARSGERLSAAGRLPTERRCSCTLREPASIGVQQFAVEKEHDNAESRDLRLSNGDGLIENLEPA